MSTEDHFNWPMPGKSSTMYLSTVNEPGFTKKTFYKDRSPNLDISDIDKAKPHYQGYQFTEKETYGNRNDDIAGSRPKKLHQPLEKVYFGLRNDDIVGTKPKCQKFTTTRSPTNPLNPEYKLPEVEVRVATPPKFVRDNIDIKDIEGAKPNPYTRYNINRKTNNVEDIDGAKPKKEWLPQGKQSSLNVKDINYFWEFHTKRQTDPLSPRYKVVDQENNLVEYGKLDNKVAVRHPKEVNKVVSFDLKTDDINGAQASTSTQHVTKLQTRDTLIKTEDIPGAQTGTLKKGIETKRQLDPLWPSYKVPGHTEPLPVYTRNVRPNTQTFDSSASKSVTQTKDWAGASDLGKKVEIVQNKSESQSGARTPLSQGGNKIVSPLMRTGEEVLNAGKSQGFGERSEYVAARTGSGDKVGAGDNNATQKNSTGGVTLETKKAMNSNETYQKNVKNFFGVGNTDENKSSKPRSVAEKFDKFITK